MGRRTLIAHATISKWSALYLTLVDEGYVIELMLIGVGRQLLAGPMPKREAQACFVRRLKIERERSYVAARDRVFPQQSMDVGSL